MTVRIFRLAPAETTRDCGRDEGVVDHAGIAAALKEIGFDGVCTIEEFRPEYYAMSHEDNVKKAAEVTRDFVQKYFG